MEVRGSGLETNRAETISPPITCETDSREKCASVHKALASPTDPTCGTFCTLTLGRGCLRKLDAAATSLQTAEQTLPPHLTAEQSNLVQADLAGQDWVTELSPSCKEARKSIRGIWLLSQQVVYASQTHRGGNPQM